MLFDLQGKRRRVVQGTYVMLAFLMGGGLVLFGVGGNINGGIFDAFTGGGGNSSNGNSVVQKRVDKNEKKVKATPQSVALRKSLMRDYYQLASAQVSQADSTFPADAKDELRKSAANWEAYLKLTDGKPDTSLARVALQIYDPSALNKPAQAMGAARLIAQEQNDTNSYLNLVQYATLAKDTRTADLAGQKAIDLAPAAQRKQVRAQLKQLKKSQTTSGAQGATPQQ
jgi:hypothetical protein